jgi:hypothetical protein
MIFTINKDFCISGLSQWADDDVKLIEYSYGVMVRGFTFNEFHDIHRSDNVILQVFSMLIGSNGSRLAGFKKRYMSDGLTLVATQDGNLVLKSFLKLSASSLEQIAALFNKFCLRFMHHMKHNNKAMKTFLDKYANTRRIVTLGAFCPVIDR